MNSIAPNYANTGCLGVWKVVISVKNPKCRLSLHLRTSTVMSQNHIYLHAMMCDGENRVHLFVLTGYQLK